MLCAGAAAQGHTRGLNFFVWNFAWDRLASRLYASTATTFLMKTFRSMLIGPPIPGIQLFQNLKLEIQGQGQSWKSQTWVQHSVDSQPFFSCQSGIPFLSYDFFKIWPWTSRVRVMGEVIVQSHNVGLTSYRLTSLLFHVNRPSHSRYNTQNLALKSRVKVKWPWCCTTTGLENAIELQMV